jgi:acyl-CoA thioester hydrolase
MMPAIVGIMAATPAAGAWDFSGDRMRQEAHRRSDYRHFREIATRWMDNDVYGHVNNVVYYSWFDTAVNQFLIEGGALDIEGSPVIGLVVETQCNYFASVAFPDRIDAGIRVARLGNSSVRYEIGIFREGEERAAAQGHFVHVYVDRASRKPATLPDALRTLLQTIHA